ncbi:thioredoxin domain-containing protein 11 [Cylas formicarius]|uniref:thioredoxin domain-containing protein 11 n=1 Tax=Cylas formicarius TaxID=197179 RepID=UPI0029589F63|nr:thioredoxin domain-containing protein 11 [Cylas formicarius]
MLTNVEVKHLLETGQEVEDKDEGSDSDSSIESLQANDAIFENPLNKYMIRMFDLTRELALFCLVLVAYAALTHDPPKVSKPPAAYPFFLPDSPVKDWYRGQISKAIELARTSDLSLIMYYSPWDAESQAAREHFEAASVYMKGIVEFAAVNCWHPQGECRAQYTKVYRWPVMIAYTSNLRGVQYSGPITAAHLISFLQRLLNPIRRFGQHQIYDYGEAYLVAQLDTLPGSWEYGVYYLAALRYLERDPLARVTFYVEPVQNSQPKLSLHLWHQIRFAEFDWVEWQPETIIQFVLNQLEQSSSWIFPTNTKSKMLSNQLQSGPAMVMFTPNNPLHGSSDYYDMLREVAQEYKNCDNRGINFDVAERRLRNSAQHDHLKQSCFLKKSHPKNEAISLVQYRTWSNISTIHLPEEKIDCDMLLPDKLAQVCEFHRSATAITCETAKKDFNKSYNTAELQEVNDYRSLRNLAKFAENERCRLFLAAENIFPAVFEAREEKERPRPEVRGLSCKTNSSLNFVAMDSLLYYNFAENLGVNLAKVSSKSIVVIIDEKRESHYIMEEPITSVNLRRFILKFTNNKLVRSLNSSTSVESTNTHSYSFNLKRLNGSHIVKVEELTSQNFLQTVSQKDETVVVMYYSKHCSFCSGISHTFLTLARKLSFVEGLKFARIDGDLNILPWEYTMEKFPTILFFPANKKSESRAFPSDLFITVPNLLGFILTNLDVNSRLQAMYSICMHSQPKRDKFLCLSNLRNEILTLIEMTLKDWRKSNNRRRQRLLRNLKQLKRLQVMFGHSPEDIHLVRVHLRKLNLQVSDAISDDYARDEL